MRKTGGKTGFTLVELSLAVGFLALLSLTITLIINDTVATYRRGLTLNEINTTGMDLVDDMRSAIQNSPSKAATYECEALFTGNKADCYSDLARSLVVLQREADVDTDGDGTGDGNLPVYGAICTGQFSYIWNSGYFFGENAGGERANTSNGSKRVDNMVQKATFRYSTTSGSTETKDNFRLLKVKDELRGVCKAAILGNNRATASDYGNYQSASSYNATLPNTFDVSNVSGSRAINYFTDGIREEDIEVVLADDVTNALALYDLQLSPPAAGSESAFYSVSFILGTLTGGLNVKAKGNFCKTPEDYKDEDFDYCAINKFNFAAQATGG